MKRDDSVYLKHILDAISLIEEYVHGVSLEQFEQTKLIQDGVIRELEIIGERLQEISQMISAKVTQKHCGNRLLA
ncbi:Uncharacterised protein [uncultured archaeon]|nr:Uncharacterised protein [uncultured archaeon]